MVCVYALLYVVPTHPHDRTSPVPHLHPHYPRTPTPTQTQTGAPPRAGCPPSCPRGGARACGPSPCTATASPSTTGPSGACKTASCFGFGLGFVLSVLLWRRWRWPALLSIYTHNMPVCSPPRRSTPLPPSLPPPKTPTTRAMGEPANDAFLRDLARGCVRSAYFLSDG